MRGQPTPVMLSRPEPMPGPAIPPRPRTSKVAMGVALLVPALVLDTALGLRFAVFGALGLLVAARARRDGEIGTLPARWLTQLAVFGAGLGLLYFADDSRLVLARPGHYVTAGALSLAVPRLFFGLPRRGHTLTMGLGLIALMGLARAADRLPYGLAVAAYLVACLVAVTSADRGWPSLFRYPRGVLLPFIGSLVLAGAVMLALSWALPAAEPAVMRALQPYLDQNATGQAGFSRGEIELGRLTEILESDEIAVRVVAAGRGEPGAVEIDYLRGQIYTRYRAGRWFPRRRGDNQTLAVGDGPLGEGTWQGEVVIESESVVGRSMFSTLNGLHVRGAPTDTILDSFAILIAPPGEGAERRRYRLELGRPDDRAFVARPTAEDLQVPDGVRRVLEPVARAWTQGGVSVADQIEALRTGFVDGYRYTTSLELAPSGVEPVVHFITGIRAGHCEYFASAFALLARTLDIPARLVGGYRVFERNHAGGYYVVRQRDAHAWVEVFVDGRWRTVDPTPPGSLSGEQRGATDPVWARLDVMWRSVLWAWAHLEDVTAFEVIVAIIGAGLLAVLWVWVRRRRSEAVVAVGEATEPFEPLARLEGHLVRTRQLYRAPHRTLGAFAGDLRTAELVQAAALVDACAALRYGGSGDPRAVAREVERYVANFTSRESSPKRTSPSGA